MNIFLEFDDMLSGKEKFRYVIFFEDSSRNIDDRFEVSGW